MAHHIIEYKPTSARQATSAWCMNPKHTRCRGVTWHRVGRKWRRPVGPVREYLRLLGDVIRAMLREIHPWLLAVAVGLAVGAVLGALLLPVFLR